MLVINPQKNPKAVLIWLHGLGANGADFMTFIQSLNIQSIEFILPDAPLRPITVNQGMQMRGWYDVRSLNFNYQDNIGLNKSKLLIENIIKNRISKNHKPVDIYLGGFSQGAALSLFTGIMTSYTIKGIISLSGYMPKIKNPIKKENLPIIAIHGVADDIISIDFAELSYQYRKKLDFFNFKKYNMKHEVIVNEIQDIREFLISE